MEIPEHLRVRAEKARAQMKREIDEARDRTPLSLGRASDAQVLAEIHDDVPADQRTEAASRLRTISPHLVDDLLAMGNRYGAANVANAARDLVIGWERGDARELRT